MPFCVNCGNDLAEAAAPGSYCSQCGALAQPLEAAVAPLIESRPPSSGAGLLFGEGRVYRFSFHGVSSELLLLYLKTLLLSVVTLGIYSFWGRAAIRRYLYGRTEMDSHRFAFHGTGGELARGALKIAAVILFLLLQNWAWILVAGEETGGALGLITFYLLGGLLTPFALVGAWRYRLSRTSYRGIRFGFGGTVKELFPVYLKGVGLTIVTLGFYLPVFGANLRRYFCQHARYGNARFDFDGAGSELIAPFIWSRVFALPSLTISLFWYRVVRFRFNWNHTTFQGARIRTDVTTGEMLFLFLINAVVTVLTLGLGLAWAQVRYLRYVCDHVLLDGVIDLDRVVQSAQAASAAGETLGDFLDVDGVDLGL